MAYRTELIRTEDQWTRLETFAAGFDHEINRNLSYIVFKDSKTDQWLAYLALVVTPVGIPAVAPHATPKQALEICQAMEGYSKVNYGQAFVLVPPDSPFMKYLLGRGFVDQNLKLLYAE